MKASSQSEALRINEKFYFHGRKCKYGHISKRYASDKKCFECKKERMKEWYTEHKVEHNKARTQYNRRKHKTEDQSNENQHKESTVQKARTENRGDLPLA